MFLGVTVVGVEMEKHFRAGGGGDSSADKTFDFGQAGEETGLFDCGVLGVEGCVDGDDFWFLMVRAVGWCSRGGDRGG